MNSPKPSLEAEILGICNKIVNKNGVTKTTDESLFDKEITDKRVCVREDESRFLYCNLKPKIDIEIYKNLSSSPLLIDNIYLQDAKKLLKGVRTIAGSNYDVMAEKDDMYINFSHYASISSQLGNNKWRAVQQLYILNGQGFVTIESIVGKEGESTRGGISWLEKASDSDMRIIANELKKLL